MRSLVLVAGVVFLGCPSQSPSGPCEASDAGPEGSLLVCGAGTLQVGDTCVASAAEDGGCSCPIARCGPGTVLTGATCEAPAGVSCGAGTVLQGTQCVATGAAPTTSFCVPAIEAALGNVPVRTLQTPSISTGALVSSAAGVRAIWIESTGTTTLQLADVSPTGNVGAVKSLGPVANALLLRARGSAAGTFIASQAQVGSALSTTLVLVDAQGTKTGQLIAPSDFRDLVASDSGFFLLTARTLVPVAADGTLGTPLPIGPSTASLVLAAPRGDGAVVVGYSDSSAPGQLFLTAVNAVGPVATPRAVVSSPVRALSWSALRVADGRLLASVQVHAGPDVTMAVVACDAQTLACDPPRELAPGSSFSLFGWTGRFGLHSASQMVFDEHGVPPIDAWGVRRKLALPEVLPVVTDGLAVVSPTRAAWLRIVSGLSGSRLAVGFVSCP